MSGCLFRGAAAGRPFSPVATLSARAPGGRGRTAHTLDDLLLQEKQNTSLFLSSERKSLSLETWSAGAPGRVAHTLDDLLLQEKQKRKPARSGLATVGL